MFHGFEILERSRGEVALQKGASEQRPSYASAAHISAFFRPLTDIPPTLSLPEVSIHVAHKRYKSL